MCETYHDGVHEYRLGGSESLVRSLMIFIRSLFCVVVPNVSVPGEEGRNEISSKCMGSK